jgi:protein involved in temperature-dependent protein secretion
MSTLRDELCLILQEVADIRVGHSLLPHANQIISLFRSELTSDAAAEAMLETRFSPDVLGDKKLTLTTPERALAAAFDAIAGEDA